MTLEDLDRAELGAVVGRAPAPSDNLHSLFSYLIGLVHTTGYDDDRKAMIEIQLVECEQALAEVRQRLEMNQSADMLSVQEQFKRLRTLT